MRLFVGVPLPEALRAGVRKLQEEIAASGADVAPVPAENLHFTVKFLGEAAADKAEEIALRLAMVAARHAPFPVVLRGAGVFPSISFVRVVWVGVAESAAFVSLVEDVQERLAAFRKEDYKEMQIHLTIARVRSLKNNEQLAQAVERFRDAAFGSFVAEQLVLYESTLQRTGAVYRVVRAFPLTAAAPSAVRQLRV